MFKDLGGTEEVNVEDDQQIEVTEGLESQMGSGQSCPSAIVWPRSNSQGDSHNIIEESEKDKESNDKTRNEVSALKVKHLEERNAELEEENYKLKGIICGLQSKLSEASLPEEAKPELFKEITTLLKEKSKMKSNIRRQPFNEEVRRFAITLYSFSPQCYG